MHPTALTGLRCIDMIISDLCVMEMNEDKRRFEITELAPDVTIEEVLEKTSAEVIISEHCKTSV